MWLPRLGLSGDVSFLIDTGADSGVIMPTDAGRLLIPYTSLTQTTMSTGIGGHSMMFVEPAMIAFLEPSGPWKGYRVPVGIAAPNADLAVAPSSGARHH
jgi:hypothetical protein